MKRTEFLKGLAAGAVTAPAIIAESCKGKPVETTAGIASRKKYSWKMVTTWPPNFPVVGEGATLFAEWVREMSGGSLDIQVYGGGELVPALEAFDAVGSGIVDMGSGAAYYWAGKSPAMQFFASVPFGMNAQQMNAWLYAGGGLELWRELYAPYNLLPIPGGNTGVQMGGWFNKEIKTVDDLRGLKMRIPGLGGKVLERAGGTAVLSPGSEIYTNLERGVIDATEWIGPYHDTKMGFHKIAKYFYYPGWHEPGTVLELIFNKPTFEALPKHLQAILEAAAYRLNLWTISQFEAQNGIALEMLRMEGKVDIRPFPPEVIARLKELSAEVINEIVAADPMSAKVYQSYAAFREHVTQWSALSERAYYEMLQ